MMYSTFKSEFYVSQAYKGSGAASPHRGIDLVSFGPDKSVYVPPDTPAAVVDRVGWENPLNHRQGYGYHVRLKATVSGRLHYFIFAHLDSAAVKVGQEVRPGDKLGLQGNTGASQFPHVHIEIRLDVPGVSAENANPAEWYGLPNAYEDMKHLKSDWPAEPAPKQKEVTATGVARSKDSSLSGVYTVRPGSWNLRNGPALWERPLTVVHGGDTCRNYGYYTDTAGVRWLYVVTYIGGVKYTGFVSAAALRKG